MGVPLFLGNYDMGIPTRGNLEKLVYSQSLEAACQGLGFRVFREGVITQTTTVM